LLPPTRPRILLFGRLEPYKGVRVLREAMETIWRTRPDVKLEVAGQGPEARLVRGDPRIDLRPRYVPEERLDEMFGRASVVALPYLEASQSDVGLQAIGRGVPVVVSNVGSLAEIAVDPEFVVPPGDRAALACALLRAIDQGLPLRRRTLAHARKKFSLDTAAARTLALYEEVITL